MMWKHEPTTTMSSVLEEHKYAEALAEIERLHEIMRQDTVDRNGYLDEIERLQRACVGAIRWLGMVKGPDAHQAQLLLRAALNRNKS